MRFTFHGDQALIYPDIQVDGHTLNAQPGHSYDLSSAPDSRWSTSAQTDDAPVLTSPPGGVQSVSETSTPEAE